METQTGSGAAAPASHLSGTRSQIPAVKHPNPNPNQDDLVGKWAATGGEAFPRDGPWTGGREGGSLSPAAGGRSAEPPRAWGVGSNEGAEKPRPSRLPPGARGGRSGNWSQLLSQTCSHALRSGAQPQRNDNCVHTKAGRDADDSFSTTAKSWQRPRCSSTGQG